MSTTQPIRNKEALDRFRNYYLLQKPHPRNYTLIILGLNTALRISDILRIKWSDVYDNQKKQMKSHLEIKEQKTKKEKSIALNLTVCNALSDYKNDFFSGDTYDKTRYLFTAAGRENIPLCRQQAYRIIKAAALAAGLTAHISCHSLRKTFGYHAWQQGIPPALLMDIYNHSSYNITKRYLCIAQDERDEVYRKILL